MVVGGAEPKRRADEARFFDTVAELGAGQLAPIDPAVLQRYGRPRWLDLHQKEFVYGLLGDLHDKRVLDVGCGHGENAVLLATLGARVTGIDISPGSIQLARRRASLNGVEKRVELICGPLEEARFPDGTFDIVYGDNVLHHLLHALPETLGALRRAARPGGLLVFIEPTNLNPTLRRIRFLVPVHTEVTPGERPLERAEIALIRTFLPDVQMRHFNFLGRLKRFLLPCLQYERASLPRRLAADALALADAAILRVPGLESLGGIAVLWGHAPGRG